MRSDATHGITIVEVLIAMLILGIAMGAVMGGLLSNTSVNSRVSHKADAIRLTEETLEGYRQMPSFASLSGAAPVTRVVTKNGVSYSVTTTFCPASRPSTMTCSATAVYLRVQVSENSRVLYSADTYYTSFGQES